MQTSRSAVHPAPGGVICVSESYTLVVIGASIAIRMNSLLSSSGEFQRIETLMLYGDS